MAKKNSEETPSRMIGNTTEEIPSDVIGKTAPAFALPDQDGKIHRLSDYKGKWVVLFAYPKDSTPGFVFTHENALAA